MPDAVGIILIGRSADIPNRRVKGRRANPHFRCEQIGPPELLPNRPHRDIPLDLGGMNEGRAGRLARAAIRALFDPVFPNGRRTLTAGNEPCGSGQKKTESAFPQRSRNTLDIHSFFLFMASWHHARVSDGGWALDCPAIKEKTAIYSRNVRSLEAGNSHRNGGIYP